MLHRRLMMQQSGGNVVTNIYKCKFKLSTDGQTNPDLGFTITTDVSSVSIPTGTYPPNATFVKLQKPKVDNLTIKITNPNNEVVTYTNLKGIAKDAGGNCFVSRCFQWIWKMTDDTKVGGYNGLQYTYNANYKTETGLADVGIYAAETSQLLSYGFDNRTERLVVNEVLGDYIVELEYETDAIINKIIISNLSLVAQITVAKTTSWNYFPNICKKEWLEDDGVFTDNMFKDNGTI